MQKKIFSRILQHVTKQLLVIIGFHSIIFFLLHIMEVSDYQQLQVHLKKLEYHEKGQYLLSLISESE